MQGIDLKWPSTNTGTRGSHVNSHTKRCVRGGGWRDEWTGRWGGGVGTVLKEGWGTRRMDGHNPVTTTFWFDPFFLLFVGSRSCYGEIMSREIMHVGPSIKVIRQDTWLARGSKEFWEKYKNTEPPELAFSPCVGLLLSLNDAVGIASTFLPQPLDTCGA